ncbi:MAG: hypothetical protein FJX59_11240 [Alphaproteobacteria bacterium]|nr:hypothetical protein [Alphaproteobacteria bacterium]
MDQESRPYNVVWDRHCCSLNYDFVAFLALADCVRQLGNFSALNLTLKIDDAELEAADPLVTDADDRQERASTILVDCCELLPTIQSLVVVKDAGSPLAASELLVHSSDLTSQIANQVQKGANARVLRAPHFASELTQHLPRPFVTLSLPPPRITESAPEQIADWSQFHDDLSQVGHERCRNSRS